MAFKLNVIIASTRPGRVGPSVAKWFEAFAKKHGKFEPVMVDLVDFNLPVYDEPKHPAMQQYAHDHTKTWAASVASAEAYVFVTPEYNYFPPPALVNALTFVSKEWAYKAAGIVSYGGASGGLRATQALKPLLTTLKMMPLPEGVMTPMVHSMVKDGTFTANELMDKSATTMLDELAKWTGALKGIQGK